MSPRDSYRDVAEEARQLLGIRSARLIASPAHQPLVTRDSSPLGFDRAGEVDQPLPRPFPTVRILEGAPPEPPSMLVDGFIADRDITLLTGPGGSAKSVVLLTIAVCVAIDRPAFGTLTVRRPGPVLLVLPEDGEAAARMMLDAITADLALQASEVNLLRDRLRMVTDDSVVNITRDAMRLRDTALEHHAVLVCGDPLRNLLGGAEENANDVAGQVSDTVRREVCRGANAAVLLTQHHRKPDRRTPDAEQSREDVRGAGGWVDGARLALGVHKRDNLLTIRSLKSNRVANDLRHELLLTIVADPANAAHWLTCRLTDANLGSRAMPTSGAASEALTPGVGRPINANERKALEAIDDAHEPGRRFSWSEWKGSSGVPEDTLKSIKKRLINANLVEAHAAGKHRNGGPTYAYAITDRGRNCLEHGTAESALRF